MEIGFWVYGVWLREKLSNWLCKGRGKWCLLMVGFEQMLRRKKSNLGNTEFLKTTFCWIVYISPEVIFQVSEYLKKKEEFLVLVMGCLSEDSRCNIAKCNSTDIVSKREIMCLTIKYKFNKRRNPISRHQIKWSLLKNRCTKCFDEVKKKAKWHIKGIHGYRALSKDFDIDMCYFRGWSQGWLGKEIHQLNLRAGELI